jgi:drug/metabolite transporter (DMT)-like permease
MTERLNLGQIAMLITYAAGMAAGQLLFKAAALRLGDGHPLSTRALLLLLQDAPFIGAIVLYAALSVLWVWLLTFTPLSRAYPFVAVAFVLTPVLGALVFAEPLSARLLVGIAVIACGLGLVVG